MASESCPICGDEVDEDEDDPCGHFGTDDEPEEDYDNEVVHLLIEGPRKDRNACGSDDIAASSDDGSVTCPACRALL